MSRRRTHPALDSGAEIIDFPGVVTEVDFAALEADLKQLRSPGVLMLFAVTESLRVIDHDAALWFSVDWRGVLRLRATSGLHQLPQKFFNVQTLEDIMLARAGLAEPLCFAAARDCLALWLPLQDGAGGLLLLRRAAWRQHELAAGVRLAALYSQSHRTLAPVSPMTRRLWRLGSWRPAAVMAGLLQRMPGGLGGLGGGR